MLGQAAKGMQAMPSRQSPAVERGGQALERLAFWLTTLAIVLVFAISGLMLARLGVAYETAGGSGWQKIHPATPVALLALLALAVSRGNPFSLIEDILKRQPGVIVFTLMLGIMMAYVIWRVGGPVTQFLDTFVLALVLFVLLTRWPEPSLRTLALCLHAFMAINALLGLAEFALDFRITPLVAEGLELTADWRSTALLGHPLLNAAATASYAFMLFIGGGRDLPVWVRAAAIGLQATAMIVFGGRVATVLLVAFALPAGAIAAWRFRGAYKMTPAGAATLVLAVFGALMAATALAMGGFFEQFVSRFVDDDGSAAARLVMLDLVGSLPPNMLWFGSDPDYIASLQRQYGIPFGIESFWVATIANQGLLLSIPFFICFLLYMNEYRRALRPGAQWSLLLFLLIISTSTALASKTTMLAVFTVTACLLLRPVPLAET